MSRETQQIVGKKSMRQTMMQGLKALGGTDVPNYTLLFLSPTKSKLTGDYETIVVPYIELGRSSKCVIQYGENNPTVSRVHGSIQWNGGDVYYKHLGTNPSLLNGNPIQNSVRLNNGDEIQLSYEGPKFRYNTSAAKTSTFKFTQRMALFTQQALKPYKTIVIGLASLLVLGSAFAAYMFKKQDGAITEQSAKIVESNNKIIDLNKEIESKQALLNQNTNRISELSGKVRNNANISAEMKQQYEQEINSLTQQNSQINSQISGIKKDIANSEPDNINTATEIESFKNDVYLLIATEMILNKPGQAEPIKTEASLWSGTGFLTADGNFYTARHVITPWKYYNGSVNQDNFLEYLKYEQSGGSIVVNFIAYSPSGEKIKFSSNEVKTSDSEDGIEEFNGEKLKVAKKVNSDWAQVRIGNISSKTKIDANKSRELKVGESVFAYGYQNPQISLDPDKGLEKMSPTFSTASVSQANLVNGLIQTTNIGFDHGASGCPVFVKVGSEYRVVGLVSSVYGKEQGVIVPIANIR